MRSHSYSLPFGRLVAESVGIYLRNIVPFTVLGALVLSPWIALRLAADEEMQDEQSPMHVVSLLVYVLLANILTGAVTFGVVQQLRGKPARIVDAISQGLSSFWRVLGTGLLCGVRILLFSLLLVVPGIIQSIRLYVAIPAAVMEGKSGGAAVERSVLLIRGSGWPLFGSWLLMVVASIGLSVLAVFLAHGFRGEPETPSPWIEISIDLLVSPVSATMAAVAYFMLRQGKENVDAKAIAAVFD